MSKKLLLLYSALAVLVAAPLSAQGPTPEGTVIKSTATVTFTDANNSTYAAVTATDSVIVGFLGSIDVTGTNYTPASPSTLNEAFFTITNDGNGIDSVLVATNAQAGLTITGYKIGATSYASLALLNDALEVLGIAMGDSVIVTVVYSVDDDLGGVTKTLELTATSRRDATKTDSFTSNITPPVTGNVSVTADVPSIQRLPNPTPGAYTATFTVENLGNGTRWYNLIGAAGGTGITLGTVNGGVDSVSVAAGATASVDVTYTVAVVDTGSIGTVQLVATAKLDALVSDTAVHSVAVIRPLLTLTKEAFRADSVTAITYSPADSVVPGETVIYKLTITNTGTANAATGLSLTDPLPAEVTYVNASGPAGWTVVNNAGTITATLDSPNVLAPNASAVIWIRVTIK